MNEEYYSKGTLVYPNSTWRELAWSNFRYYNVYSDITDEEREKRDDLFCGLVDRMIDFMVIVETKPGDA